MARHSQMTKHNAVFLFDVDNTLLDNDRVTADLKRQLEADVGSRAGRYWEIFEQLRAELGYADYLGALQRYRTDFPRDPKLLCVSHFLIQYPFANRLFPGSLDAVQHVQQWGPPVILSDGDVVFQPHKIYRSGLMEAFDSRVLIYVHKERELDHVQECYPAGHYVLIDDKIRILTAVKQALGSAVTTVFVRQGHYALDPRNLSGFPNADITLERIGELVSCDFSQSTEMGQDTDRMRHAAYQK
jgi:FMN phosphatase YigB (HAD superfamily)